MNYEKAQSVSLQSSEYKLTAADYAFIILNSKTYTLNQKMSMWREIMLNTADCAISPQFGAGNSSLHKFLDKTIEEYETRLADFYSEDNCVYSLVATDSDEHWQFTKLQDLLNDLSESGIQNGFSVRKQQLTSPYKRWIATFNSEGEILELTVSQRQQDSAVSATPTVPFAYTSITATDTAIGVSDKSKGIPLETSYSNLSERSKHLFDRILRTVSALSGKSEEFPITRYDYKYCIAFTQGNIKIGRLSISNGIVVFECKVANTDLKYTAQSEMTVKSRRYKVVDGKSYHTAMDAFYAANKIAIEFNKR